MIDHEAVAEMAAEERRIKAKAHLDAIDRINIERDAIVDPILAQIRDIERAERKAAEERVKAQAAPLHEQIKAAELAHEEAWEAADAEHDAAASNALLDEEACEPQYCAASGLLILDDDETIQDTETGELFLRRALGLPQRGYERPPFEPDDAEAPEAAPA